MATPRSLIKGALRLIGAYSSSETPTADEIQDALTVMNEMFDSWATENLMTFTLKQQTFPLIGNGPFTYGPGGDFDEVRPVKIQFAYITNPNSQDFPLEQLSDYEYSQITVKNTLSSMPTFWNDDCAYPQRLISLWPQPNDAAYSITFLVNDLITTLQLDTNIELPPGYEKAIRYNLAKELAIEYGATSDSTLQQIMAIADESKGNIKRQNYTYDRMPVDAAILGERKTFNWITGE